MEDSYTGEEKWRESDIGDHYSSRAGLSTILRAKLQGGADDSKTGEDE